MIVDYYYLTLIFCSAAFFSLGAMIKCEEKKRFFLYLVITILFFSIGKKCYDLANEIYHPFVIVIFFLCSLLIMYCGYRSEMEEG